MRPITSPQLKIIHTLLNDLGIMDRKQELIYSFSDGRTESSRELSLSEAKGLIEYLKNRDAYSNMINRIWHLSYEMEIIKEGDKTEMAINSAFLNEFCLSRGTVKKPLQKQSLNELKRTVKQFEAMYGKFVKKKEDIQYLSKLTLTLECLIEEEDYEKAAIIRDEINLVNTRIHPRKRRITNSIK